MANNLGQYTLFLMVGGIVTFGMLMYISADQFPPTSTGLEIADKAICTILTSPVFGNYTCNIPDDSLTFVALTGMTIGANNTHINFTSTGGGGETNTASNRAGDEGIFGAKVGVDLEFKSLTGGTDITVSSDANTITIDSTAAGGGMVTNQNLDAAGSDATIAIEAVASTQEFKRLRAGDNIVITNYTSNVLINATDHISNIHDLANVTSTGCASDEILKVSGTSWVCASDETGTAPTPITSLVLTAGGSTNSSTNGGQAELVDGTNFDYWVVDFDQTTSETRQWNFELPDNFNGTADITAEIHFETSTATGGVCWDLSVYGSTVGADWDDTSHNTQSGCNTSLDTPGDINEVNLTFTSVQHALADGDLVVFKLSRDVADANDDMAADARLISVRLSYDTE